MAWNEEQKRAIESRGRTMLVSAAAGSGKTAVLIERITRLITEDRTGIENMLVVTFTKAAAGEMKSRLAKSLSAALKASSDPAEASFLRSQLSRMGSADISTFDAFVLKIVKSYFHVIGAAPGLKIADDARLGIMSEEAMEELFSRRYASAEPSFLAFMDRYTDSRSDERARQMILRLSGFLESLPYPDRWLDEAAAGCGPELLRPVGIAAVKEYVGSAAQLLRRGAEIALHAADGDPALKAPEAYAALFSSDAQALEDILALFDEGRDDEALAAVSAFRVSVKRALKAEKEAAELVSDRVKLLNEEAKKKLYSGTSSDASKIAALLDPARIEAEREVAEPFVRELISLTREYESLLSAKKEKAGVLSFSDARHFALRILENDEVCEEYRKRFSCIFVDEYQDSDRVQEALISRISRPGNVFMVGDVKQSIYKFRLAEPEIFMEKYEAFRKGGSDSEELIDLNANYRSKREVVDFVNSVFSKLMTRSSSGMDYDERAALREGAPYTGPLSYKPVLYLTDMNELPEERIASSPEEQQPVSSAGEDGQPELSTEADEIIEELKKDKACALQAARIIAEYHGRPVYDAKQGIERPLRYRDMAILLPEIKNLGEQYYRTLERAGIPSFLARDGGYFDTLEVSICMDLLRIIDNGRRDLPLISVMHFPVFGFSEADLAEIRAHCSSSRPGEKLPYSDALRLYAAEGPDGGLRARCADFLSKLAGWRTEAAFMPLRDFLRKLINTTGIGDYIAALPGGRQRSANVEALAEKAAKYEEESFGGIYGFISYVEAIKDKVRLGEVRIFSEDDDAVRIMTVHGSKGLEFPFVLVSGLDARPGRGSDGTLQLHKDIGIGLPIYDSSGSIKADTSALKLIAEKHAAEERAEKIRLMYVAMTRAKDILVFGSTVKGLDSFYRRAEARIPDDARSASSYLDLFYPAARGLKIRLMSLSELAGSGAAAGAEREKLKEQLAGGFEIDGGKLSIPAAELKARIGFAAPEIRQERSKYSVSQLAELARGDEAFERPEKDFDLPRFMRNAPLLGGAARGTAYHSVMEHIPFTAEDKAPEDVAAFTEGLVSRGLMTRAEADAVDPARISAFFSSDIGRRACAAKELRKEAPFTFRTEKDGRGIMVQGTIDCCFIEDGSWVLVDYKSNYVDYMNLDDAFEHLKESYIPQLALYREALEKITGIPVKEAVLYLFSIGQELRIE